MSSFRTYRDATTGVVREYPPSLALSFPQLIEVESGAKPLAYTPIPHQAVVDYLASTSEPEDDETPYEEEED